MTDNLTSDDLVRLVDSFPPLEPRPVIIVAHWLRGPYGLRRVKDGREEFRISSAAFAVLERQAVRSEWDYGQRLGAVPVESEDQPPRDLFDLAGAHGA